MESNIQNSALRSSTTLFPTLIFRRGRRRQIRVVGRVIFDLGIEFEKTCLFCCPAHARALGFRMWGSVVLIASTRKRIFARECTLAGRVGGFVGSSGRMGMVVGSACGHCPPVVGGSSGLADRRGCDTCIRSSPRRNFVAGDLPEVI